MNEQLRAIAELDRVIHEPGRMMIVALLAAVVECDFLYLQRETELSKGNLSSHLAKLEKAGYVEIKKAFLGKVPQTLIRLTPQGRATFEDYRTRLNTALIEQLNAPAVARKTQRSRHPQPDRANSFGKTMALPEAI